MYRQNAHNMSYMIINDQHKFLEWDPTKQINYGRHASKMLGGTLSFTVNLGNFITSSHFTLLSNPWFGTRFSLSAGNVAT